MQLDTFLEIHSQGCIRDECPMKLKTFKNTKFAKGVINLTREMSDDKFELYFRLIQLINMFFIVAIKKFLTLNKYVNNNLILDGQIIIPLE